MVLKSVLRIRDSLVRIQLLSSWTFKTPTKSFFYKVFLLVASERTFTSFLKDKKSLKIKNDSRKQGFC